jgi:hypothetical protein
VKACELALEAAQVAKSKGSKKTVPSLDERRITEIVRELHDAYKDPALFTPIYERLSGDQTISKAEMAAIASQFAYETPPSTARVESLRRIFGKHEKYATSAAKSKSSAGKSAA